MYLTKKDVADAYGITRAHVYGLLKKYKGLSLESFRTPDLVFDLLLGEVKSQLRGRLASPSYRQSIQLKLNSNIPWHYRNKK